MKHINSLAVVLVLVLTSGALSAAPPVAATPGPVAVAPPVLVAAPVVAPARLAGYQMKPAHVVNIQMDDGKNTLTTMVAQRKVQAPPTAKLNVTKFGADLHATLQGKVNGYVWQIRQNGTPIANGQWEWAKRPVHGGEGWTLDTRMHIASISKLVTGIAMARLIDEKNLSYDAKIIDYLPAYWAKGPNVDKITFRHLLTHKSGFKGSSSESNFGFMKSKVASGVNAVGGGSDNYDYENMNYGLCRILMAVINGDISKGASFPTSNDSNWDIVTTDAYLKYVQDKVFTPSGVANATVEPSGAKRALAYNFPATDGWNSADLSTMSGGAAWHVSLNELLRVMDTFRRKGSIVSSGRAQGALDGNLGVDWSTETPIGKAYMKNGRWADNGRTEQSVAYFFPQNVEFAIFVNSPVGTSGEPLADVVRVVYLNNLE